MLDIGDNDRRDVKVKLLHRVVCAESKEACARTIDSKAPYNIQGGDSIISDVFCPDIP